LECRGLVALEDWPPALLDRVRIDDVLLVHFVYEPLIGSEFARGTILDSGHVA
jgi:hypothetical protein